MNVLPPMVMVEGAGGSAREEFGTSSFRDSSGSATDSFAGVKVGVALGTEVGVGVETGTSAEVVSTTPTESSASGSAAQSRPTQTASESHWATLTTTATAQSHAYRMLWCFLMTDLDDPPDCIRCARPPQTSSRCRASAASITATFEPRETT
jgi:hypothetical protein